MHIRTGHRSKTLGSVLAGAAILAWGMLISGETAAEAKRATCSERSRVLGVERIIEIDTTSGPLLGNMQYRDIDFLRPGEVVLTFDDGPLRRHTKSVLNALEAHCTKATFFMVGRMAAHDPDMVREIYRRGHTVGTHTWSHKNLKRQSRKSAIKEIELGVSAISAALGKPAAPFFRFPYLADPKSMISYLQERQMGVFSIDIDSVDFRTRSGATVVQRIMRGLKRQGKGVLLFHDIQKSTARGIRDLLDRLHAGGYKIVHIVAKEPVATLPNFDKLAEKELAKRRKSAASRPLASRSIVWPVYDGSELPSVEPLKAIPKPVKPETSEAKAIEGIEVPSRRPELSSSTVADQTTKPVPRPKRATRTEVTAEDWRDDVFQQ